MKSTVLLGYYASMSMENILFENENQIIFE